MGKSSRQKRRTYQTPKSARTGGNLVWYAAAAIVVIGGIIGVAVSRSGSSGSNIAPTTADHWHIALGVNDCGSWVPNWAWPATDASTGQKDQFGTSIYASLHSHEDGLIHIEPDTNEDGGNNATLGTYFRYGGWKLSQTSIKFVNVNEKNGNKCDGKPGVLRWSVNGKEQHTDPRKYKLNNADVVELVFTTAGAKLPPITDVPSYTNLQQVLGVTPTTSGAAGATTTGAGATTTSAPGATTTTAAGSSTSAAATTTSKP